MFIKNSQTSKNAESTGPTLGYHQGQSRWDCQHRAALLPTNKQMQLSAPELEGRPPNSSPSGCCGEVSSVAAGLDVLPEMSAEDWAPGPGS